MASSPEIHSYLKTETLRVQKLLLETLSQGSPPLKTDYQIRLFIAEQVSLKTRKKLGLILCQRNWIQIEQLENALLEQQTQSPDKKLGELLVQKGIVSNEHIYQALAEQYRLPYWHITTLSLPENNLQEFNALVDVRKYAVVPVSYDANTSPPTWTLAITQLDIFLMDTLSILLSPYPIKWVLTSPETLYYLQETYFPIALVFEDLFQSIERADDLDDYLSTFDSSLSEEDTGGAGGGGPPPRIPPPQNVPWSSAPPPTPMPQPQKPASISRDRLSGYGGPPPKQPSPTDFPPFPEAKPAAPGGMPPFPPPKPAPITKEFPPPPPPPPPSGAPATSMTPPPVSGGGVASLDLEDGAKSKKRAKARETEPLEKGKADITRAGGTAVPIEDVYEEYKRTQEEQKKRPEQAKKKMKKEDGDVFLEKERAEIPAEEFFKTGRAAETTTEMDLSDKAFLFEQDQEEAGEVEGEIEALKRKPKPIPKTETRIVTGRRATARIMAPEPTAVATKRKASLLTLPFSLAFQMLSLPFKMVGGFIQLAADQSENFHRRLEVLVLYMMEGLSGEIVRDLEETPWFEKLLGNDAGQPGPFERFVAQFRFLLHIFQMTIGTYFILFAHLIDIVLEFVASYIHTVFQAWNISKTLARAAKRKLSNTEIEEICKEFLLVKKQLSRLFVFSDYQPSGEEKPTFPLELVLKTRYQLAEMKRDLSMLTEKQIQNFVKEQASDRLKSLLPNPLDLIPAFKDLFLMTFFVKYSRQEIEKMYIDLIHSYRRMIQLKASSLGYDLLEEKISLESHDHHLIPLLRTDENIADLEWAINETREKIQRIIHTLCRPEQYFDARKWNRYDLIRENSKTLKSIAPHPKFPLELERWLTQEVEKHLQKKGAVLDKIEIALRKKESKLLREKLKKQKKQDYHFL